MKIFLDVDGPILDVSERYYAVHCAIAGDSISLEFFWQQKRAGLGGRAIVEHNGLDVAADEYSRRWVAEIEAAEHMHLDALQPGVLDAMDALRAMGTVTFVSLRQNGEQLQAQLRALGVARDETILSASPLSGHGPSLKVELVREHVGECTLADVMVGDTRIDLEAGRELGVRTIGVTCGIRTADDLAQARPDRIVKDLRAAVEWLRT